MSKIGNYTEAHFAEHKKLETKAKDCGVKYGIYSKEYAKAIHEMNDYYLKYLAPIPKETFKMKYNRYKLTIQNKIYGN